MPTGYTARRLVLGHLININILNLILSSVASLNTVDLIIRWLTMAKKIIIGDIIGHYITLEVSPEDAIKILKTLRQRLGKGRDDVDDAIRMIEHFDVFYDVMKKKFKEYLTPRKNVSDVIKGDILVDKIKLLKKGDVKSVIIVFDKNVNKESLLNVLKDMGYDIENR